MDAFILYGDPRSTYVRTTRIACEEKGVGYQLKPVDLASPDYRKLHPFGRMPAAQHVDRTFFETSAIVHYIDEACDGPPLRPADARGRAQVEQWISVTIDYLYDPLVRRYVLQYAVPRGPAGQPDRAVIDAALEESRQHLGVLDQHLQHGPWLAGDQCSLADFFVHPILYYVARMPEGEALLEDFPAVREAMAAMALRPSMSSTVPA